MRRFYLVAILLASVGCERIEPDEAQSPLRPSEETPALMKVHARVDETRTSLGGPRGTEVRSRCGEKIRRRAAVMRSTTVLRAGRLPISPARLLKARSITPAIPIVRMLSPKVRA